MNENQTTGISMEMLQSVVDGKLDGEVIDLTLPVEDQPGVKLVIENGHAYGKRKICKIRVVMRERFAIVNGVPAFADGDTVEAKMLDKKIIRISRSPAGGATAMMRDGELRFTMFKLPYGALPDQNVRVEEFVLREGCLVFGIPETEFKFTVPPDPLNAPKEPVKPSKRSKEWQDQPPAAPPAQTPDAELENKVLKMLDQGVRIGEIVEKLGVSREFVDDVRKSWGCVI